MLSGLVTRLLNRYLARFIKDLDAAQLGISIFKGDVALDDLQLQPALLDSLPLPIELVSGRVGHIRLALPLTALAKKPVRVELDDVSLVLR